MQFLCNILQVPVDRPKVLETTALGAAWLAGMKAGLYPDQAQFAKSWSLQRRFSPNMDASRADDLYKRWKHAVAATLAI